MIHKRKNTNSIAVSNVKMSLLKPYSYNAPAFKWAISKTLPSSFKKQTTTLDDLVEYYKNNQVRVGIEKKDKDGNVKTVKIVTFCPIIKKLNSAKYKFTPVMGEHEYNPGCRGEQKPVTVSATQILAFSAPFTIMGNKAELYTRQGFSDIVEQFLNGLATAYDLFGGTMLNANQWVRRFKFTENNIVVNEYDKARFQTFIDVQKDAEGLKARVEKLIKYYKVIFEKPKGRELIAHSLMEGIATGSSAHYIIAQMMSPNGQAVNYDEVYESFKNMTDDSKPAIHMGTKKDTSNLFTDKTKMLNRIIESHKVSKNHEFTNRDALEYMREILASKDPISGYGLYLDPDYVNFEAGSYRAKENAGYNEATAWMKNTKRFCEEVVDALLVPLRDRGVRILLTNEYNETLIKHLKKRGFYVAWTTRGNNKPEIVATSFCMNEKVFEQPEQVTEAQEAKNENVAASYCSSVVATQAISVSGNIAQENSTTPSDNIESVYQHEVNLGFAGVGATANIRDELPTASPSRHYPSILKRAAKNILTTTKTLANRVIVSLSNTKASITNEIAGVSGSIGSISNKAKTATQSIVADTLASVAGFIKSAFRLFDRDYKRFTGAYYRTDKCRCDVTRHIKTDSATYRRTNYLGLGLDSC